MQRLEEAVRCRYQAVTRKLIGKKRSVSTMESCTAGLIASLLTDTEGASAVFLGGYVTYNNEAKIRHGVPAEVIRQHGVYSTQTAAAMASACRKSYGSHIGIGVTGTFGNPDPANPEGMTGQAFFAVDINGAVYTYTRQLPPQESRFAYKLVIADEIAKVLEAYI